MKVLVTGGTGFLGKHVLVALKSAGHEATGTGSAEANLESHSLALRLLQTHKPEVVVHLAAQVGGIMANRAAPGSFWQSNTLMGVNVLDACLATRVKRVVVIGTTCSYPRVPKQIPFVEEELFEGYPEETNAPYGMAKRNLIVGALTYRKQFGLDCVAVVPTNLYGVGDNFDDKTSHVIPALLSKMHWAALKKEKSVTVWGTGKPTRDFLNATDAARGIVLAMEKGPGGSVINLGSGEETRIRDVVEMAQAVTKFKGTVQYDHSYPDGQPRRVLDIHRAHDLLGWEPTVELFEGMCNTFDWWRNRG